MSHSDERSAADSQPQPTAHAAAVSAAVTASGTASAINGTGPTSVRPPLHAATPAAASTSAGAGASSVSPVVSRPSSLSHSSSGKRVSFDLTPTAGVLTESLLAGSFTDSDSSVANPAHTSDIALTSMSDQRLADRSKQSYSSIAADDDDDMPPPLEDAHGHGHGNGACSGHGHSHSPALSSGSRNQRSPGTPGTPRRSPETNCGGLKKKTRSEEANRKARRQLGYASVFCLVFMICEIIGGLIANSLAIMTDAAHLLSDLAGFLISIFALWLATRPATSRLSFGFHRAEIIGALLSVLLIWVLTGILVYEACWRMVHPEDVDGKIMFIVAVCGLAVNFAMGLILMQSGHGHSHGGLTSIDDDHGHSHSHGGKPKPKKSKKRNALTDGGDHGHSHGDGAHGHSHGGSSDAAEYKGLNDESAHSSGDEHDHDDGHGHAHGPAGDAHGDHPEEENLNVKAAFIHVLGDAIQSFGVMIAAALIWHNPEWRIADPLCTFLFSILVLFTTTRLIKQSIAVLMEGVPEGIDPDEVEEALMNVPGVIAVHDLHIWSLSVGKPSLSVHLYCRDDASHVLAAANKMCAAKYNIQHSTIQVERQHDDVECNDAFVQVDGHASLDRITADNFASLGLVAEQV